ncbi:hypothetical protein [Roseomonas genomospecies 6]|nr:hypothetical protein [Roseomonas genomospecies 6]
MSAPALPALPAQVAPMLRKLAASLSSGHPDKVMAAADNLGCVIDFINRHDSSRAARHLAVRLGQLQRAVLDDPPDAQAHASWLNTLINDAESLDFRGVCDALRG